MDGGPVTITMTIESDPQNGGYIYSFGPSGCKFDPPAVLYLKYRDLGIDNATLYYVDDQGNYIEHMPDDISLKQKWFKLTIHHFSRYAVAWGDY